VRAAGGRNVSSAGSPTTYAQNGSVVLNQVKVGASSVLFLPGIQASLLSKPGLLGIGEDQVWPPNALFNEDVYDLSMGSSGVSDEAIYTNGILENVPGGGGVYAGFKSFMDQLKADEIVADWEPFAYDWRYSVDNVAQNGTQYRDEIKDAVIEIERLADSSLSGQVTIIGHSNGGLLAKAIVRRLEAEVKAGLVDKIILLASPQNGTPKAIGTILHGYDQTDNYGGFVMDGQIVREVTNNLPGAYGLLPSEKYFEGLDVPLVSFADTAVTAPYRQTYGASISNYADYTRFLRGEDGFDRDLDNAISVPARANGAMLGDALSLHDNELDDWVAPAGIEVIEVVGTGLPTMKAVEYREILEDKCLSAGPLQVCTPVAVIKPYAVLTKYGDGTVVQRSAAGYGGEKSKYFVNLLPFNNSMQHYNITEAAPVQDLLGELIIGTTTNSNQFISTSHTEFNDPYEVEMIDSPVRLLAGNETGVVLEGGVRKIKQEIPGSQYFEFGDTKYFVVPKGTNRTTRLYGEEYGGYTLTTATLGTDDVQRVETILPNASTSPTMLAEYSNHNGVFSNVVTDSDGDGTADYETTLDGELIEEEVVVTYPLLITTVEALNLSKLRKQALLLLIKSAQYYGNKTPSKALYLNLEDAALKSARDLTNLYLKKGYITATDAATLLEMIQVLKDKQ
jgi:pimeloyl-ACP methyl ester carboxylesterase